MRSDFVIKLIEAFNNNDDETFKNTVLELSEEERKKGNVQLANKISTSLKSKNLKQAQRAKETTFSPSSGLTMFEPNAIYTPKDKASNNSLIDWHFPDDINEGLLVLSNSIKDQITFIKNEYNNQKELKEMGLPFENRVLLCGPPGCGKTSTAFSLAKSLSLPLAYVRLDSLISSLLGQTGTNIRKIFESVNKKNVVLFLDEFDAIAKKRDDKNELGELKRVVNTLLQNIDLLSDDVFIIAATNHQDLLDSAVWRRFHTVLYLDLPDQDMRLNYLEEQLKKFEVVSNADLNKILNITKGFNFSQLNDIVAKTIKTVIFHEKRSVIETIDFIRTVTNMLLLFNDKTVDSSFLYSLRTNGLTLREISEITGIPKSTISDRIKELNEVER
ncbi:AAA family ATPase [Paenibacillus taichungensis]